MLLYFLCLSNISNYFINEIIYILASIYSKEIFSLLNNGLPKFWKKFLSKILSYQAASAEKSSITKKNKRTPVKSNSMQAQRKIVKTQKFDNASPRFQKKLPIEKPLTIKKMQNKSLMNSSSNSKTCEDLVKTVKGKEKESFSPKQKKSKKASPKKNEKGLKFILKFLKMLNKFYISLKFGNNQVENSLNLSRNHNCLMIIL